MPGNLMLDSSAVATVLAGADFSGSRVTIVGFGGMGKAYLNVVRSLGVGSIRVCSQSAGPLAAIAEDPKITVVSGGYAQLPENRHPDELIILALPIGDLVRGAEDLARMGFRRFLIEKPVALESRVIKELGDTLAEAGVEAFCAFNRCSYPSLYEVKALIRADGGVSSCSYDFTELVNRIDTSLYSEAALRHWGLCNSMHVISMAHAVIGEPAEWRCFQSGSIPWHPSGAEFAGAGVTGSGVPFSYSANWGSTSRWRVEFHTKKASYLLCPLEQLKRRTEFAGPWEDVPIQAFDGKLKVGFAEQVASVLNPELPLDTMPSLFEAARLTEYAEAVFGYGPKAGGEG